MLKVSKLNNDRMKLEFSYNNEYILKISKIPSALFHKKEGYWSIIKNIQNWNILKSEFDILLIRPKESTKFESKEVIKQKKINYPASLNILFRELNIRKFSKRTISSYMQYNKELLKQKNKEAYNIKESDIKDYLYYLSTIKKYKASTLNIVISSFKFFYGKLLHKNFIYKEIKRPKESKKLPVIMNREEIKSIIKSTTKIRDRILLMFVYSSGLRVSELVKLKHTDIDNHRNIIHIKDAKGRKDRYTTLSKTTFEIYINYCSFCKSKEWLFPGQKANDHISVRTAQKIFKNTLIRANISKNVGIHSLRHSFATHILEDGGSLRYIQELLGHQSSKTTEIYTHVCKTRISEMQNPLDRIFANE